MRADLKYGLIAGALMSAWMLLEHLCGLHTTYLAVGRYTGVVGDIIPVVVLYLLLKHQLTALQRYWLPLWEGMFYGLVASFVAALVFFIFLNLYKFFLNPTWIDLQLDWKVAQWRLAGTPEAEIQRQISALRVGHGPIGMALTIPIFALAGAAVAALITLWLNWRHKEIPHDR